MPPPASRASIIRLLSLTANQGCRGCGRTHSVLDHAHNHEHTHSHVPLGRRGMATPVDLPIRGGPPPGNTDYAFEMAASNLRFGAHATSEVGMDFANLIKEMPAVDRSQAKIGVFTDPNVAKLPVMEIVEESLLREGLDFVVWDKCAVEPTDKSWQEAVDFSRSSHLTHFLAVGGGSSMDTAKAANLFTNYPNADLYEFINAPIGKGTPITKKLSPLIAIPTTAGTGSETTGTAILDIPSRKFKTGIASRALKPTLGIVDLLNTATCPKEVAIAAGLDVLFHSLESWTAVPYHQRTPRPANPINRPAYQGSNPISDIFSKWALETTVKYLPRIARDPSGDEEARAQMLLAASTAGIGFGNAGVHMCHAFSYPISSLNKGRPKSKQYHHPSYSPNIPLIPHGVAVSLTAPAVFNFTAPSSPDRHREALLVFLGKERAHEANNLKDEDLGPKLSEEIQRFLDILEVPRGLSKVGYTGSDITSLVEGCLPQRRVLDLAPVLAKNNNAEEREQLSHIVERSMNW
ncbi:hydroxyacid-oxoacid transhydrogenase [Cryptococcus gattii E566]|uniref:hydroxyacid-oxoacid transhydrogenase n=2 Tax=Cryptococcus gattii TaxID=37769 RepID=E6R075_CRYGW|nr:Alcohol dehydrogenase, putative [Cryptococcus gattii WM276]ADV20288.1 Alcohol dehydrogenase, putative [Cryptococcus gattii WM276]KIR77281.1 hydroxyacid-oxoacid transhydrogenase [Cryptococcus gattii EJB2]KIY36293.1 hydroxyacid-oxoacid transhydrogenase [Cryptococcus gattii E566]KJE06056.1 hydroxyacid-oxoacid transhydrogenase [Cryptococcus gattii NT-10]